MTRTHAAYQLLRHGPLNLNELEEITGWTRQSCIEAVGRCRRRKLVRLVKRGSGACPSVYEART